MQGITSATVTSKAVVKGANTAIDTFNSKFAEWFFKEVYSLRLSNIFYNGVIKENPIFVQLIGMCATLAITTSALNGLSMGLSVIGVLVCSNFVISLLRNVIPDKVRIPAFVVVIATFVTMVDMFLKAFAPAIYSALGLFIPLIVVNCIIFARAETFASKTE